MVGWRRERESRTLETVPRLHTFQACAFDHSAHLSVARCLAWGGRRARAALPCGAEWINRGARQEGRGRHVHSRDRRRLDRAQASRNLTALGVETVLLPGAASMRRPSASRGPMRWSSPLPRRCDCRWSVSAPIWGWPFYVEKPLSHDPAEVEAILAVSGELARRSMVGFMMRYHPAVRDLAPDATSRSTTRPSASGMTCGNGARTGASRQATRLKPRVGGCCSTSATRSTLPSHAVPPGADRASVTSLGHDAFPGVDFATTLTLAAPGILGTVAMDYLSPVSHRRILLRGTAQEIDLDLIAGRYRLRDGRAWTPSCNSQWSGTTCFSGDARLSQACPGRGDRRWCPRAAPRSGGRNLPCHRRRMAGAAIQRPR